MESKLFIYGTLADPEVQQNIWGRVIEGIPDVLKGYKKFEIEIERAKYPIIISDKEENVKGLVIEVFENELKKIDEYETKAYRRIRVILESGTSAWAYAKV